MSVSAQITAPAKVNLRLRVLARRADGYHDIDTLFQAIDWSDEVTVRLGGDGVRLAVSGADVGPTEENLAYRAAVRFVEEFGLSTGVDLALTKRIPAGAGLGGGSSDAAAVLRCLALLGGVRRDDARLAQAAAAVGSDVPFFLTPTPLARGRGRGERLEPLPALPPAHLVLVSPPVHVSTADAYAALAASRAGASTAIAEASTPRSWTAVAEQATNDFQPIVSARFPEVTRAATELRSAEARFVLMSGSGSSVFGMFDDFATARGVATDLAERLGWPCRAARTLEEMPTPVLS